MKRTIYHTLFSICIILYVPQVLFSKEPPTQTTPAIEKPVSLIILERKASSGDVDALFETGLFYFKGAGIPQDIPKAIHYLTLASEKKHKKALYNLATLYLDGTFIQQDTTKGLQLLQQAEQEGYAPAQVAFAFLYLDGKICTQNIEKAYEYLCIAEINPTITDADRKEIATYKKNIATRLTKEQADAIEKEVRAQKISK